MDVLGRVSERWKGGRADINVKGGYLELVKCTYGRKSHGGVQEGGKRHV